MVLNTTDWSARRMVFAPLILLSATFVVLTALFVFGNRFTGLPAIVLLGVAVPVYILALFFLGRLGMTNVAELKELGRTDSLSGLPNRRALHNDVAKLKDVEIAIALIDLDGFKSVNDHYGHAVGDQVIKYCSAMLREKCADHAGCYRLGGDEFALQVSGQLASNIMESVCRSIIERFHTPIQVDGRPIMLGASIGLARRGPKETTGSSEMLRQADVAMYASKRGGKMRSTWYVPQFDRSRETLQELASELRQAYDDEDFCVHYQPLVSVHDKQIVAVEALLRWERGDAGPVSPATFIPVAEETGLIHALGLWVLTRACTDALRWPGLRLSVNISAAQLRNPDFPIRLGQVLEETGFPGERLELEITETCLVLDPAAVGRSLDLIRNFGVHIVLDDFGTGYASIGFLRQFRFEKLKLDRSLVHESQGDDSSRAMMVTSISIARALMMSVTAEGVETEEQADLVRAAGCDELQGWLYHKAMPASEIERLMADAQNETEVLGGKVISA